MLRLGIARINSVSALGLQFILCHNIVGKIAGWGYII